MGNSNFFFLRSSLIPAKNSKEKVFCYRQNKICFLIQRTLEFDEEAEYSTITDYYYRKKGGSTAKVL